MASKEHTEGLLIEDVKVGLVMCLKILCLLCMLMLIWYDVTQFIVYTDVFPAFLQSQICWKFE